MGCAAIPLLTEVAEALTISHFVRRFPFNPVKHPRNFRSLVPDHFGE